MADLRITDTQGYLLYREVEPVQPYPRIDPQQPHDETPRGQDDSRGKKDEMARRRFVAMRSLIDGLKKIGRIERIDYQSLINELTKKGITAAEQELFDLLSAQQIPPEGLARLAEQIREQMTRADVSFGSLLTEKSNFLPYFSNGLAAVQLCYRDLELLPGQEGPLLIDAIAGEGLYRCATGYLQVEFYPQVRAQYDSALNVDIRIMVAAGEKDEENRRAILFERTPGVFALYTDKQISLSI
ncbi:MAG: hypothetical protein R6V33_07050 [Pelovirga sp.]